MKAPDKIFVAIQSHPREEDTIHASLNKTAHPRETEYIRKDYLMEWTNAMVEKFPMGDSVINMVRHNCFLIVKEKLESL